LNKKENGGGEKKKGGGFHAESLIGRLERNDPVRPGHGRGAPVFRSGYGQI